jgi:hypothetical protein
VLAGILIYLGCIMLLGLPEGVKNAWAARWRSETVKNTPKES